MLHPSTRKLIDRLAEMTANHQLDWSLGSDGHPQCTRAQYTIVLQSDPLEFRIRSTAGKDVERVAEAELQATDAYPAVSYLDIFRGMRSEALRHAREQQPTPAVASAGIEQDRPDLATAMAALRRARGITLVRPDGTRVDPVGGRLIRSVRELNDE